MKIIHSRYREKAATTAAGFHFNTWVRTRFVSAAQRSMVAMLLLGASLLSTAVIAQNPTLRTSDGFVSKTVQVGTPVSLVATLSANSCETALLTFTCPRTCFYNKSGPVHLRESSPQSALLATHPQQALTSKTDIFNREITNSGYTCPSAAFSIGTQTFVFTTNLLPATHILFVDVNGPPNSNNVSVTWTKINSVTAVALTGPATASSFQVRAQVAPALPSGLRATGTVAFVATSNGTVYFPISNNVAVDSQGFATTTFSLPESSTSALITATYSGDTNLNPSAGQTTIALICTGATLIEIDPGTATYPDIAMDANGNAIAVWSQLGGTRYNVWANRYIAGSGWDTPTLIESNGGYTPQIVSDTSGNFVVVWSTNAGAVWANRYTAGSGWGVPTPIQTSPGWGYAPQIAIDANGNTIAVWNQDGNIWANRYTPGTGWGTATLIQTTAGGADVPQVAVNANGSAIAVWSQTGSIWANRYIAGSGWGTAELIQSNDIFGNAFSPQVEIDGSGNAIAVWSKNRDVSNRDIWARRYTAGSGWGAATLIETNTISAAFPQIAMDANGNAIVVWQQGGTWANRYTAGSGWGTVSGWGTATRIANAGDADSPQIVMDAKGNAFAAWSQFDGTRYNIWANRYTAGSGWRAAELIETDNAGNAFSPQIAIGGGNTVAVWSQHDGTRYNIWANYRRAACQ